MDKVIIFPTDTVYGVGTGIDNLAGLKKIYKIKGRDYTKPIAVLCANVEQIKDFAILTKDAKKLADAFWPGALTLILKTKDKYRKKTLEKTIGVRIPNHKKTLELLEKYGPMRTTSVNISGEKPLNSYSEIKPKYEKIVDEIFNNDEETLEKASTVINLSEGLFMIREGNITINDINEVLKKS